MSTQSNVTLDTTLSWAVPVRIDKLGAHLEAYIQMLPTITALRLCGRFGTGPQCHINKLPAELINAIGTFVVEPARVEALETWSSGHKCFEVMCDIVDDHFTQEEQRRAYVRAKLNERPENDRYRFTHTIVAMTTEECRNALLTDMDGDMGCWVPPHNRKCRSWIKKVDTDRPTCIFNEHRALVRSHFGVDVWTSNVRLPTLRVTPVADAWKLNRLRNTTVAYTTLPTNILSREEWLSSADDNGDLPSGSAMPAKMGAISTEASLRRFPRALNLLGLEVFLHPTQKKAVHSAPTDEQSSDTTDVVDEKPAEWPQLVLLEKRPCREPVIARRARSAVDGISFNCGLAKTCCQH